MKFEICPAKEPEPTVKYGAQKAPLFFKAVWSEHCLSLQKVAFRTDNRSIEGCYDERALLGGRGEGFSSSDGECGDSPPRSVGCMFCYQTKKTCKINDKIILFLFSNDPY